MDALKGKVVYVKHLPHKLSPENLYDIFWRYGVIRQIRRGVLEKKGNAIVVYDNEESARSCVSEMNGFNVGGKYVVCYIYK